MRTELILTGIAALLLCSGAVGWNAVAEPLTVERGSVHTVWRDVSAEVDDQGNASLRTNSWTELASGLNYWSDPTKRWEPAVEAFELTAKGYALAMRGQHRLILAPDINEGGSVDLELPGGARLRSNPMGLTFFDRSSGKNVLLAEVTNCVGELVAPNIILYRNCFDTLRASLRYVYTRYGVEQLVILHENPGSPDRYGLVPEFTTLEMMTEFMDPPAPTKALRKLSVSETDEELDFGTMRIGAGLAYAEEEPGVVPLTGATEGALAVAKLWQRIDGRSFLIESVPVTAAQSTLERLPTASPETIQAASLRRGQNRHALVASLERKTPGISEGRQIARISAKRSSEAPESTPFVLDYQITLSTSSQTNYVFKGDATYFVSGRLDLYGTTTIEGGTVIKYANTNNASFIIHGPVNCATSPYRMAVLTAKDDDSVGEIITGSTGAPSGTYGWCRIWVDYTYSYTDLHDLRFVYGGSTVLFNYTHGALRHCQFVKCRNPVQAVGMNLTMQNVLLHQVADWALIADAGNIAAEHLTLDEVAAVFIPTRGGTLGMTNSLLSSITNNGYAFSASHNATNSGGSPYTTVLAGSHYLTNNTYRNAGTTNISPGLLAQLGALTTYPPLVLTNGFSTSTVLSPQAQRDTDLPDLGYHYYPLDYCWSGLGLTNATLNLTNGVAVGIYGIKGLTLQDGARVVSEGTALKLNRYVRYNTVQEQPTIAGTNASTMWLFELPGPYSTPPTLQMRFTDIAQLANEDQRRRVFYAAGVPASLELTHCQVRGGYLVAYPITNTVSITIAITNSLIERTWSSLTQGISSNGLPLNLFIYNSLLRGGHVGLAYVNTNGSWSIRDNLLDSLDENVSQYDPVNFPIPASHNAAWCANALGSPYIYLTSCAYQAGPLGSFYYPTNGGTNSLTSLINAGSRSATNAGLYHFTTTTNQVKEASTQVDIGYHYVAVDASTGQPLDYDGDGSSDYLEDRNGNGTADSGETSWQSADDLGLTILITQPKSTPGTLGW
jgi:hypothetical protein